MGPIESLMNEHRLIESVLDALESYVSRLAPSSGADPGDLDRFVTFFRQFADRCHHGKEEDILFQTMIEHGFPKESGPIAVMLQEHDQGRHLIAQLTEAARSAGSWTDQDRARIRQAALLYSDLLHHHIQKEDGILYPMALSQLSEPVIEEIGRRFDVFEGEETGEGEHERFHRLAGELAARYGTENAGHSGHHHH
jgi:hemerythrin-like domain-containing protein